MLESALMSHSLPHHVLHSTAMLHAAHVNGGPSTVLFNAPSYIASPQQPFHFGSPVHPHHQQQQQQAHAIVGGILHQPVSTHHHCDPAASHPHAVNISPFMGFATAPPGAAPFQLPAPPHSCAECPPVYAASNLQHHQQPIIHHPSSASSASSASVSASQVLLQSPCHVGAPTKVHSMPLFTHTAHNVSSPTASYQPAPQPHVKDAGTMRAPLLAFDEKIHPMKDDRYVPDCVLGHGTYGVVVRCLDRVMGSHVAMKIAHRDAAYRRAALAEAHALQALASRQPSCDSSSTSTADFVRVLDVFEDHGRVCIVTELLHKNLFELQRERGFSSMSLSDIRRVGVTLFRALSQLHAIGYIHCDVKPENVMSRSSTDVCNCCLIDFGAVRTFSENQYYDVQSLWYRAPEVLCQVPYTSKIDSWGVGCVLYELCTGSPLVPGDSPQDQLQRIQSLFAPAMSFSGSGADLSHGPTPMAQFFLRCIPPSLKDHSETLAAAFADLLSRVLCTDERFRLTCAEALHHPFFTMPPQPQMYHHPPQHVAHTWLQDTSTSLLCQSPPAITPLGWLPSPHDCRTPPNGTADEASNPLCCVMTDFPSPLATPEPLPTQSCMQYSFTNGCGTIPRDAEPRKLSGGAISLACPSLYPQQQAPMDSNNTGFSNVNMNFLAPKLQLQQVGGSTPGSMSMCSGLSPISQPPTFASAWNHTMHHAAAPTQQPTGYVPSTPSSCALTPQLMPLAVNSVSSCGVSVRVGSVTTMTTTGWAPTTPSSTTSSSWLPPSTPSSGKHISPSHVGGMQGPGQGSCKVVPPPLFSHPHTAPPIPGTTSHAAHHVQPMIPLTSNSAQGRSVGDLGSVGNTRFWCSTATHNGRYDDERLIAE